MNNYILHRRHPEYAAHEQRWRRAAEAYSGGRVKGLKISSPFSVRTIPLVLFVI